MAVLTPGERPKSSAHTVTLLMVEFSSLNMSAPTWPKVALAATVMILALSALRLDSTFQASVKIVPESAAEGTTGSGVGISFDFTRPSTISEGYLSVPVRLTNLSSVYEAKAWATVARPDYSLYVAGSEADRIVPATVTLPLRDDNRYEIAAGSGVSLPFSIERTENVWGGSLSTFTLRVVVVSLLCLAVGIGATGSPVAMMGLAAATLVAEFPGARVSPWILIFAIVSALVGAVKYRKLPALEMRTGSLFGKAEAPLAFAILGIALTLFGWYLWRSPDFRWSIFEERDFLAARRVLLGEEFPVLGPQLLAGGQTPGGGLYLWLAPLLALKNDPVVFSWFNRFAFLGSAMLLALTSWRFVGPIAAVAATLLFCSSNTVMGLAYWPIHPNFSLLLSFLFAYFALSFHVEKKRLSLCMAVFLFSWLIQFHVTYLLLAIPLALGLPRERKTLLLAGLFFLLPFSPYLLHEISTGFSNLTLVLAAPRFQKVYVPQSPLMAHVTVDLLKKWLGGASGPGSWLGLALFTVATLFAGSSRSPLSSFFLRFVLLPFLCLSVVGMGYAPRHFISIAAMVFLFLGFGADQLLRTVRARTASVIAVSLTGFLLFTYAGEVTNRFRAVALTRGEGEWAVSYLERKKVADYLISELGISQAQYEKQVYWWWLGWSMSPELYAAEIRSLGGERRAERRLRPDQSILILSEPPRAVFLTNFDLKLLGDVARVSIYEATPKTSLPAVSNTANRTSLSAREAELERMSLPAGLTALGSDAYVISLAEGRLRVEVSTHFSAGKLRWSLESPHFNGYYQEIKTLWKPRLVARNRLTAAVVEIPLAGVLGNMLEKTPLSGEFSLSGVAKDWDLSFKIAGYFDQSAMAEPVTTESLWKLTPSTGGVL